MANSVDSDHMLNWVASDLGLHSLPGYVCQTVGRYAKYFCNFKQKQCP